MSTTAGTGAVSSMVAWRTGVRRALAVILLLCCTTAHAQLQPAPDVRQPYNGLWYDPTEPGTGVTISTQGRLLVALIYTYRPDGVPLWLLASGTLSNGQFDAPLTEFRAGQCIGCGYSAPQVENQARRLRLEFASHTVATMRIDDGPPDRISAFPFGVVLVSFGSFGRASSPFSEPWLVSLLGCWTFVHGDDARSLRSQYRLVSLVGPPTPNGPGTTSFVASGQRTRETRDRLSCIGANTNPSIPPHCSMRENVPVTATAAQVAAWPIAWTALVGDIGPDRIIAFEGGPRPVEPGGDPRGPNLVLGFRTASRALEAPDPRDPGICQ